MDKQLLKNWVKTIEESNEAFNKMTKAEKRVTIAKDVIKRVDIGQIDAYSTFISFDGEVEEGKPLKPFFNAIQCSACAKGSLFLSYVGRVNKFKKEGSFSMDPYSKEMKKIKQIFSQLQLDMIEIAFEGGTFSWTDREKISNKQISKSLEFFKNNTVGSRLRLKRIMENIIENNGTFKP
jgi:hypothetical protein